MGVGEQHGPYDICIGVIKESPHSGHIPEGVIILETLLLFIIGAREGKASGCSTSMSGKGHGTESSCMLSGSSSSCHDSTSESSKLVIDLGMILSGIMVGR
jgi:hypothetical protein